MKRIALIVTCLALMLAIPSGADEATIRFSHQNAATMQALLQGDLPDWQVRAHGGPVELPEGIETTEAVMEQNAIRAVGTEAGIARLRETLEGLDKPIPQIEIATTWIDVQDPDLLPRAPVTGEVTPPKIALLTRISEDEIAALKDGGTILNEPRTLLRSGFPGTIRFNVDANEDGRFEWQRSLGAVAQVNPDDTIGLMIDFRDMELRPEAPLRDTSLQVMVRVANEETILVAAVGEDGAIVNPVYLVTTRVIKD
jgi:hypothetical protein